MANPSPKNWNQDLVFAMPERADFGGTEGSAEEWATGYDRVLKEMMESEVVLRRKCLLEMVVKEVGLGAVREMGLVVAELGFWGGFGGCGGRERRMAMRELRWRCYYSWLLKIWRGDNVGHGVVFFVSRVKTVALGISKINRTFLVFQPIFLLMLI